METQRSDEAAPSTLAEQAAQLAEEIAENGDAYDRRIPSKRTQRKNLLAASAVTFLAYAPGFDHLLLKEASIITAGGLGVGGSLRRAKKQTQRVEAFGEAAQSVGDATGLKLDYIQGQDGLRLAWLGSRGKIVKAESVERAVELAGLLKAKEIVVPEALAKATGAPYTLTAPYADYVQRHKGRKVMSDSAPSDTVAIITEEQFATWKVQEQGETITSLEKAMTTLNEVAPKNRVQLAIKRGPMATRNAAAQGIERLVEAGSANVPFSEHNPTQVKEALRYEVRGNRLISRVNATGQVHEDVPLATLARQVDRKALTGKATDRDTQLGAYIQVYTATHRPNKVVGKEEKSIPEFDIAGFQEAFSEQVVSEGKRLLKQSIAVGVLGLTLGISFGHSDMRDQIVNGSVVQSAEQKLEEIFPWGEGQPGKDNGKPSTPDWVIHRHGGLSAYGHWAEGVSHTFAPGESLEADKSKVVRTEELPTAIADQRSLEVTKTLNSTDAIIKQGEIIDIPVRVGLRVAAASLRSADEKSAENYGWATDLLTYEDGTYKLRSKASLRSKRVAISYWLVPDQLGTSSRCPGGNTHASTD